MNTSQLDSNIVRLKEQRHEAMERQKEGMRLKIFNDSVGFDKKMDIRVLIDSADAVEQRRIYNDAVAKAERNMNDAKMHTQVFTSQSEYINRHYIEWHRKFSLSVACIVLFLVGAPFGSIVRKGGLGLPLVASVVFFVLYYVIGMIAEKAVREGALGSWGMWISTIVMIPIGIGLIYKAVQR